MTWFFPRFTPSHEQSVAVFIENSSQSVLITDSKIRVSEALELSSQLHHCIRRIIGRLIQHSVTHWHLLMREVFEANKPWHAASRTEKWSRLWQIFPLLQPASIIVMYDQTRDVVMLWPSSFRRPWVRINMLINTNLPTTGQQSSRADRHHRDHIIEGEEGSIPLIKNNYTHMGGYL